MPAIQPIPIPVICYKMLARTMLVVMLIGCIFLHACSSATPSHNVPRDELDCVDGPNGNMICTQKQPAEPISASTQPISDVVTDLISAAWKISIFLIGAKDMWSAGA